MRKKREFVEGAFYHVTSRTNDKIRVFENKLGRRIMLKVLQEAKVKYLFKLANFCVMPTHIHLLIQPEEGTNLSMIMQWIKTRSARRWNFVHGSIDHVWGDRYFAKIIKDQHEFETVMDYIDQNPVKAGLAVTPVEWKPSGAFYKSRNIFGLVDFEFWENKFYSKIFFTIPDMVSKLLPSRQLSHTMQYLGVYADEIERLNDIIPTIPKLDETENQNCPVVYLHYFTGTADYYIYEYDGDDTMYGKVQFNVYPAETVCQKFSLAKLKGNPLLELEWCQTRNLGV